MGRIVYRTEQKPWRGRLDEIKKHDQMMKKYYSIQTDFEHAIAQEEYNELLKKHRPAIRAGVLAEHETALQKLERAHNRVKSEKKKEIAGWDASRLASEMQVYNMLIDQAIQTKEGTGDFQVNTGQRIEKVYEDAQKSGDKYKQRAAAEVMKAATSKVQSMGQDTRFKVNRIAQQSKTDLEEIRKTPEFKTAYEDASTAYDEYYNARREVIRTSQAIGEGDPLHPLARNDFTLALKRVQDDGDNINIYAPDDPHVTGLFPRSEREATKTAV